MRAKKSKEFWLRFKAALRYLKISYNVQTRKFFENSTLHGVKYIAANDRPFVERFMWFTCVTLGAIATLVVIFSLWDKFQTNPTITGLDTDFHNWKVPFPAVILCPEGAVATRKIKSFLDLPDNETGEMRDEIEFLIDLTQLSITSLEKFAEKYKNGFPTQFRKINDLRQLTLQLAEDCRNMFENCNFKDEDIECCQTDTKSFFPVLTEMGVCYAFNSKHLETDNLDVPLNMQYIKETDIKWSLEFSVIAAQQVLIPLYIVNSDDILGINIQPQLIWDFKVNTMSFSFKETYTTEDTKQLSIKQRRCVFEDEIKLKVDNKYTYSACTIECRMEMMRSHCGCIPHFYPKISNFDYCDLTGLQCVAANLMGIKKEATTKCDCQLGCKNTVYDIETQKIKSEPSPINSIRIGFASWPMVRYKREVLFGWVDLLVSFGGIAGLFLGFSLLSGVEIFYYFTIRAWIAAFKERHYLDRVNREQLEKPPPPYDLSMTPYFIAHPLPGRGIDQILKSSRNRANLKTKDAKLVKTNNRKWAMEMKSPFGIEFRN